MSNDHSDGRGKPVKGSNHDDILNGSAGDDRINGRGGDDQIFGNDGNDVLKGGKGNDVLAGGPGNDILYGNAGNDILLGGAGDDILYGDDKSHGHASIWWLCKPAGFDDYLDGGSGNDKVYGGAGNDFANYTMAENLGARDFYDGGRGSDTLQLKLTYGEFALASVQADIANYQAFLTTHANPLKDKGAAFHFTSFNLDAADFEVLKVELVNTAPTAANDTGTTDEDTVLTVSAAAGLLANDTDPDHLDVLHVTGYAHVSAMGAAVVVNADGSYSYDPTGVHALQALGQGASATDTFTYTIADLAGATSTATASIRVTGNNDAPVAQDDAYAMNEDGVLSVPGTGVLGNDTDIDSSALTALLVSGPAHGSLALSADGSFIYTPDADFNGSDAFTYRANDGIADSRPAIVNINISEVNDAPTAVDDTATLDEDSVAIIAVLDNDRTGPANEAGQVLTIVSADALHGVVTINSDGTLSYAPAANYNGADTISYTIRDNGTTGGAPDAKTSSASVSVTVNPVNDDPVAFDANTSTDERTPITFTVPFNHTDVDGDTVTVTTTGAFLSDLGAAVVMNADGVFTYDPTVSSTLHALNDGQSATDGFSYTVSDGNGGTATARADIVVNGLTDTAAGSGWINSLDPTSAGKILDSVAPASANLHYVVKFDNGNWLDLDAFSMGWTNSGSVVSGGSGGGAGKSSAYDVNLALGSSATILDLTKYVAGGTHVQTVEIEAYTNGLKGPQLVDEFKFSDVLVTSLSTSGPANGVSLDYASFTRGHLAQDAKGATVPDVTGWDFTKNIAISGSNPVADAAKAVTEAQVPASAELDYYVRFENGDWLKLDGFNMGISNSGSIGGSGSGAGKSTGQDVNLSLGSSSALLGLTNTLLAGKHLTGVEIEAYASGGSKGLQLVDEFKFDNVLVTSLSTNNASSNGLSFVFDSFIHGHVEQDDKGAQQTGSTGWDFANNTPILGAPAPVDDAVNQVPADSVAPGTDLHYFVKIGNGNWLELDAFSTGWSNSASVGSGGSSGGAGKSNAYDVNLALGSSATILDLTKDVTGGTHVQTVEIEAYADGAKGLQLVDEFKFSDVLLASLNTSGASNSVSFDYASFTHGHLAQDAKGATVPDVTGWDFTKNIAISGSNPVADAAKAVTDPQVSADTPLHYYLRIDSGNWLDLASFSMGVFNSSSIGSGGSTTGKAFNAGTNLALGSSAAILDLTQDLLSGKHLQSIEIETYADSAKGLQLVDEFKFNDVLVKFVGTSGPGSGVGLDYASFTHGHVTQDAKGATTADVTGWDFTKNIAIAGDSPVPDAAKAVTDPQVAVDALLDYYVRIDNGNWLDLGSFSMGWANLGSIASSGGGGAGKAIAQDVYLALGSSATILDLTQDVASGKHLQTIEIEAYTNGSKGPQLVDEFRFNDVLVKDLNTSGTANDVVFGYASFTHGHVAQDTKGVITSDVTGWDFAKNVALAGSNPIPDAAKAVTEAQVSADANLDYYVHFVGTAGWLKLDSFSMNVSNSGSIGSSGGGASAGKATASDVHLTLGSSNALLDLTDALLAGTHLTGVEIEAYNQGSGKAQQLLVDEFRFENVLITSLDTQNASSNALSFDFGKFAHGHVEQDSKGATHSSVTGWDFEHNSALLNLPLPHADVDLLS